MNKGMISNFHEADEHLIYCYDEFVCAMEFSTPLSEVRKWTEEDMSWAKTTLKVRNAIQGGK